MNKNLETVELSYKRTFGIWWAVFWRMLLVSAPVGPLFRYFHHCLKLYIASHSTDTDMLMAISMVVAFGILLFLYFLTANAYVMKIVLNRKNLPYLYRLKLKLQGAADNKITLMKINLKHAFGFLWASAWPSFIALIVASFLYYTTLHYVLVEEKNYFHLDMELMKQICYYLYEIVMTYVSFLMLQEALLRKNLPYEFVLVEQQPDPRHERAQAATGPDARARYVLMESKPRF